MTDLDTTNRPAVAETDYGIAPSGSPLYAATIGVGELARSIAFYRDEMGFDVLDQRRMAGPAFEAHWRLPRGATADVAVLSDRGEDVGPGPIRWSMRSARRPESRSRSCWTAPTA